jgi:transposase
VLFRFWRKGHRYITVVVDHDRGRLVWAAEGRNQDTLGRFFDELGEERAGLLTHVSADGAEWIHNVAREQAPQAVICLDPFHVVRWATEALGRLRRRLAAELQAGRKDGQASTIRHTRWALVKNPEDLSPAERGTLAQIAADNGQLYRGYLMRQRRRGRLLPAAGSLLKVPGGRSATRERQASRLTADERPPSARPGRPGRGTILAPEVPSYRGP